MNDPYNQALLKISKISCEGRQIVSNILRINDLLEILKVMGRGLFILIQLGEQKFVLCIYYAQNRSPKKTESLTKETLSNKSTLSYFPEVKIGHKK